MVLRRHDHGNHDGYGGHAADDSYFSDGGIYSDSPRSHETRDRSHPSPPGAQSHSRRTRRHSADKSSQHPGFNTSSSGRSQGNKIPVGLVIIQVAAFCGLAWAWKKHESQEHERRKERQRRFEKAKAKRRRDEEKMDRQQEERERREADQEDDTEVSEVRRIGNGSAWPEQPTRSGSRMSTNIESQQSASSSEARARDEENESCENDRRRRRQRRSRA